VRTNTAIRWRLRVSVRRSEGHASFLLAFCISYILSICSEASPAIASTNSWASRSELLAA
jgi:hypothetical protein